MMDFLQVYYKKITKWRPELYCSPLFMLTLREILIIGFFSRNIHFEVKYLENGLADYSDAHIIL